MKKTKPIIFIPLILLLLNSCSTLAEGLGGGKKKGSDEFLIEKKAPLALPPSYGELPEPGTKKVENQKKNSENLLSIEEMIGQSSSTDITIESKKSNSSTEKSIIEKINEK